MCTERSPANRPAQRGLSLVELIVFIVIMSVGVLGVLSTMSAAVRFSAEPMLQKQLTAIAESLLAEALHQPFTFCDPDDVNALSATSTAGRSSASTASSRRVIQSPRRGHTQSSCTTRSKPCSVSQRVCQ